uniref:Uncharacterized protein n=1 Tax=Acrobeloides nanus TaxID=290746 RepID=A0A914EJH4_9BILA
MEDKDMHEPTLDGYCFDQASQPREYDLSFLQAQKQVQLNSNIQQMSLDDKIVQIAHSSHFEQRTVFQTPSGTIKLSNVKKTLEELIKEIQATEAELERLRKGPFPCKNHKKHPKKSIEKCREQERNRLFSQKTRLTKDLTIKVLEQENQRIEFFEKFISNLDSSYPHLNISKALSSEKVKQEVDNCMKKLTNVSPLDDPKLLDMIRPPQTSITTHNVTQTSITCHNVTQTFDRPLPESTYTDESIQNNQIIYATKPTMIPNLGYDNMEVSYYSQTFESPSGLVQTQRITFTPLRNKQIPPQNDQVQPQNEK